MKGFTPGLLDRLMNERSSAPHAGISAEQLKDSIARDLEALLNTRIAFDASLTKSLPAARGSILHYGVIDFAALCLSSSVDRAAICASIEQAVRAHEPRLREIHVTLEQQAGSVNRLHIAIRARLVVDSVHESVSFDAVLQPSSLHYDIGKATREPGR